MDKEELPEINDSDNNDLNDSDSHDNRTYKSIDFNRYDITGHTFENCVFESCHFMEMSVADSGFLSCSFLNCEVVLTKLDKATLNTVIFKDSKIMGISFEECNKFGFLVQFEGCLIDNSMFIRNNLKKGRFISCHIRNADFTECDMKEADFSGSRFERTSFKKCILEKADFRTASDYGIDPFDNKIKKARFSLPEAQSFLKFLGIEISI